MKVFKVLFVALLATMIVTSCGNSACDKVLEDYQALVEKYDPADAEGAAAIAEELTQLGEQASECMEDEAFSAEWAKITEEYTKKVQEAAEADVEEPVEEPDTTQPDTLDAEEASVDAEGTEG